MSIEQTIAVLARYPDIELAIVFGSVARGEARRDSDLDIAIQKRAPLNASEKMQLAADLAVATGRPVDLIDLHTVGEPLLGQILKHGRMIRGEAAGMTGLMQRHVYAMEDFIPYVERTLGERRHAWIG
ncbi:MAG: nucleotidyltransferase domain-containing protein [Rhodanobacter sp.]|nr:MAG: nucleotidyltransferase domain-containing protein [Rhodanobacter sp.]